MEVQVMVDRESTGLPRLVRGSVVTHRRRCGKPNCRCADGEALHETTVLSYSEGGRSRLLRLPADQVAGVRAATERYGSAGSGWKRTGRPGSRRWSPGSVRAAGGER